MGSFLKNPQTEEERLKKNFDETPLDKDFFNSLLVPKAPMTSIVPSQDAQEINPVVKDYLIKNVIKRNPTSQDEAEDDSNDYNGDIPVHPSFAKPSLLDKFSPEAYQAAVDKSHANDTGMAVAQLIGGIGDAIAGRNANQTAQQFANYRQQIKDNTVGDFERQKASAINDVKTKQQLESLDPNSQQSQSFRNLVESTMPRIAKAYGDSWQNVTAADASNILDFGKMREQIDARKEQMQLTRENKASDKQNQAMAGTVQLLEQMRGAPGAAQAEKDLYAADKAKTLMNQFQNPNPQMVKLLVQEIGKIASGGTPSIHELDGLTPNTLASKFSETWQKLSNSPTPANVQAFLKDYMRYADGLTKDAQKTIQDRYGRIIESKKGLLSKDQYNTLQDQYVNRFKSSEPQSKIKVSNGKETLMIEPSDLEHAQADGYKQVN